MITEDNVTGETDNGRYTCAFCQKSAIFLSHAHLSALAKIKARAGQIAAG